MSVLRSLVFVAASMVALPVCAAPPSKDFRDQQWQRLSRLDGRDDVTAAIWIALPPISGDALPEDFDAFEKRAAERFKSDPQILFALATVCQQVEHHCADARYRDALVRIEPQNAINWLLLPDHAAPDAGQLHAAATAQFADSNLRTTLRLVRTALRSVGDSEAVAGTAAYVPLPEFRGFVHVCKTAADAPVADCTAVAKLLAADRSGALLTRMIASATIQRMLKGTPDDLAAKQMRRDYVWLSEQSDALMPDLGRMQEATVRYGEWDAMLRAADAAGVARTPPAGWVPRDPQTLLISEERKPAK
jgi:hypothetical protein